LILYVAFQYIGAISRLQFPGPVPIPILGNALDLAIGENIQDSIRILHKRYGRYVDLSLRGGKRYLLIDDVDFSKAVIKSTDRGMLHRKTANSDALEYTSKIRSLELWGNSSVNLLARSNDFGDWKLRRRLIQPAFDQKHVRAMMPKISTSVHALIQSLMLLAETNKSVGSIGPVFDMLPILQEFGLDFILKSSLGVSLNETKPDEVTLGSGDGDRRWIIEAFKLQCKLFRDYQFDPEIVLRLKVAILPALGLNKLESKRKKETKRLRSFIRDVFEKEEERQMKINDVGEHIPLSSLISILVASTRTQTNEQDTKGQKKAVLSKDDIMDEINSFMFAGYDTLSSTLCILFYHISTHPNIQQKVHDEIDAAIASTLTKNENEPIDFVRIIQANALPYLSACIRESQRLQPITPILMRRTEQATELNYKNSKMIIPKGTTALIPIYQIHRNEAYYKDSERYIPERWLEPIPSDGNDENGGNGCENWKLKTLPKGLFYAFGGGPKMCVGYQLADKELKMTALGVLSHFNLHNPEGEEFKIEDKFVTGPTSLKISVTKRHDEEAS